MTQVIQSQVCRYCQGSVHLGEAEETMLPTTCTASLKTGLVCNHCGYVGQGGRVCVRFNSMP